MLPAPTAPFYDPPYDSPIEDCFALNAVKYLHEECAFTKQVEVPTICSTYVIDFVATRNGWRVGIECDGREFHDKYRDEWRDALIFGANGVDVMYRLRGCDVHYQVEHVLHVMSQSEPDLFSERGKIILDKLESNRLAPKRDDDEEEESLDAYHRRRRMYDEQLCDVWVGRQLRVPMPDHQPFWTHLFARAQKYKAAGIHLLDEMIEHHRKWMVEEMDKRKSRTS